MEGSVALGAVGYRGKVVELGWGDSPVARVIRHQKGQSIWVDGPLPEGPCEVRIAFLSEAYHGVGVIHREVAGLGDSGMSGGRGFDGHNEALDKIVGACDDRDLADSGALEGDWIVTVDGVLSLTNERFAPRVPVDLPGVYYLRPPSLGVPMRVIDVSVLGLALSPVAGESPEIADRRMISFSLEGREIKTVIEVVAVEVDVWRGRFLRLSASDEETLAGFVLARQVAERQALSLMEIRAVSTLDVVGRRGAPLLERVQLEANTLTIAAGDHEVTLPITPRLLDQRDRCRWLVGRVRLGDLRDLSHFLDWAGFDDPLAEMIMAGAVLLTARLRSCSIGELLRSLVSICDKTSIDEAEMTATVGDESRLGLVGRNDEPLAMTAYGAGVGLYEPAPGMEVLPRRLDPVALAAAICSRAPRVMVGASGPAIVVAGPMVELIAGYQELGLSR